MSNEADLEQQGEVVVNGSFLDGFLRRAKWYALLAAAALFLYYFLPGYIERKTVPQMPVTSISYTPAELIDNLDVRLKYLQSRVTGVSFYIRTIKGRENLWKLASRNRYSVHTLIGANPQLKTYEVNIGQKILVPSRSGTLHVVQKNESWQEIAERYKSSPLDLVKFNSAAIIEPGEMVFVPERRPAIELMNESMRDKYELRALFVSPLGGRLSSTFGTRRHPVTGKKSMHGGIDIAVREGTWVGAAADGVVTVAGSGIGHYGTAVYIEHDDGYVTHYGHLSKVFVRPGQKVKARKLIAKSGSTGRSTGPHLHFTIKKNDVSKDPLKFIW